jgi:cytochrome c
MKQLLCVISFVAVALSACGNKNETETTANAPSTSPEQSTSVSPAQNLQSATVDGGAGKTASTPATMTPAAIGDTGNSGQQQQHSDTSLLSREQGLALAGKSGCLACHKIETKLVGPAWRDVSKRYQGDAEAKARLIAKVKAGGKGNWTDVTGGVAMPPNSPRVSDENIEKLVAFVLSL